MRVAGSVPLVFALALLASCGLQPHRGASSVPVESVSAPPPVVTTPSPSGVVTRPLPPPLPLPAAPAAIPVPLSAAALALVASANNLAAAGDYARAAAALERALGISPQNAELWHRLAKVRLAAGEFEQAAQLAAKSNSLAGNDPDLKTRNEQILRAAGR